MSKWHGWIIEESLDDQSIFKKVITVKMKSEEADWHEHVVEIPEEKIVEVVNFLKKHLKNKWYAHMVKDDEIIVVFRGKSFRAKKEESFEHIEYYGIKHGIPKDQMDIKGLFRLAKESGF